MQSQNMEFQAHTSEKLTDLFLRRPYQGNVPELSKIVFLSSDANYSPEITNNNFFRFILEYQKDGVAFWEKYGVHHPFLIDEYPFNKTKSGRPFHNNFRRLGLDSSYAKYISFVELLDRPTIGNKSENRALFYKLANQQHLERIDRLFNDSDDRLIFTSGSVLKDMLVFKKQFGVFTWLPEKIPAGQYVKRFGTNELREIYHFSSSHIHRQIKEIRNIIDDWLEELIGDRPRF